MLMRTLRSWLMPNMRIMAGEDKILVDVELPRGQAPVVHVHHHYHGAGGRRRGDAEMKEELKRLMNFMEQMRAAVSRNTDAVASNEQVLKTLSAELRKALEDDDPEAAKAILDQIDANTANIARAAAENTTPKPVPPSEPIPDPEPAPQA